MIKKEEEEGKKSTSPSSSSQVSLGLLFLRLRSEKSERERETKKSQFFILTPMNKAWTRAGFRREINPFFGLSFLGPALRAFHTIYIQHYTKAYKGVRMVRMCGAWCYYMRRMPDPRLSPRFYLLS